MKTKYQMLRQLISSNRLSKDQIKGKSFHFIDFSRFDFSEWNFSIFDFSFANFSYADFSSANFSETTVGLTIECPEEGAFVAWKKANGYIIKLLICEDAKRSSATTKKCRCSKAKCLAIENMDGSDSGLTEIASKYDSSFTYKIGEVSEVHDFDKNRWNECAPGIHFFMNRKLAECY